VTATTATDTIAITSSMIMAGAPAPRMVSIA
jgi:hypothetical protein